MSFGTFYEVDESVRKHFEGKSSVADWYAALGEISIQDCPSLEAEESIPGWEYSLRDIGGALDMLFSGDLSAKSESDDPDVVYLSPASTRKICAELNDKGIKYFEDLLNNKGCSPDIWLYAPMLSFFENATSKHKAVIVIWGG